MISLIVKFRYYDEAVVNQAIRFFRCQTLYHWTLFCFLFNTSCEPWLVFELGCMG